MAWAVVDLDAQYDVRSGVCTKALNVSGSWKMESAVHPAD